MTRPIDTIFALALTVPVLATLGATATVSAQESLPAAQVLNHSVAFHDPQGAWGHSSYRLQLSGIRPGGSTETTSIVIDNVDGRFHLQRELYGSSVESTVTGDDCWTRLDGSSELSAAQIERYRLSCEAMRTSRDYYSYLYGLPMKLHDAGTIIDPQATRTTFQGQDVWVLRVTYDIEVGGDTWYFYFDPFTWALTGYRFYHDEAANDGEYIVLESEARSDQLRLPKVRTWYTNSDDKLLGTDTIRSIRRLSRER